MKWFIIIRKKLNNFKIILKNVYNINKINILLNIMDFLKVLMSR